VVTKRAHAHTHTHTLIHVTLKEALIFQLKNNFQSQKRIATNAFNRASKLCRDRLEALNVNGCGTCVTNPMAGL
jgi:hypothetical protein